MSNRVVVTLALTVVCIALASTFSYPSAPRSLAELLREHHIDVTKDSLLNALQNADPDVRGLAASKLAEDRAGDAVPALAKALADEHIPGARISMAFALALLGDGRGERSLSAACNDAALPGYLRVRAAVYMVRDLHHEACLGPVLGILQSDADSDSRIQALSLLPSFCHATKEDSGRMLELMINALNDQTPALRMQAGITLATLGDPSAVPYLQSAIAKEADEAVRSQMQSSIRALQHKHEE